MLASILSTLLYTDHLQMEKICDVMRTINGLKTSYYDQRFLHGTTTYILVKLYFNF